MSSKRELSFGKEFTKPFMKEEERESIRDWDWRRYAQEAEEQGNSKKDEKCDAASFALQETLQGMMTQKEVQEERRSKEKEEQLKIYLELEIEEAVKKRKLDMGEADQAKKLAIKATFADTKAKELALAIMSVNLTNMSPKRKS
ncbi:hypothetical protein D1007_09684 [Hordeum vulgare]|nr:hypothetical protein D1007_09684 [Hordeum vulgare]